MADAFRKSRSLLVISWVLGGPACAPPEARDPSEIIAEDPSFLHGQGAVHHEGSGPPPRTPEARTGPRPEADPQLDRPASYADCQTAHRHVMRLGIEEAIRAEQDPEEQKRMRYEKGALLESPAVKTAIREAAEDCVTRRTTKREAACIAKLQSTSGVDRCSD